jgi:hypothetical protein
MIDSRHFLDIVAVGVKLVKPEKLFVRGLHISPDCVTWPA